MDQDDHGRDAAAEAFEGVRGELALLRRAIEGIAARADRPEPPDYSETLGQITKLATVTYQRAEILRKAAKKETVARQVAARITGAVAEDRQAVKTAAGELPGRRARCRASRYRPVAVTSRTAGSRGPRSAGSSSA